MARIGEPEKQTTKSAKRQRGEQPFLPQRAQSFTEGGGSRSQKTDRNIFNYKSCTCPPRRASVPFVVAPTPLIFPLASWRLGVNPTSQIFHEFLSSNSCSNSELKTDFGHFRQDSQDLQDGSINSVSLCLCESELPLEHWTLNLKSSPPPAVT